ncbi:MAG: PorP/SprF family type IX secretion system membrane protein [Bacteroidota bacterium]
MKNQLSKSIIIILFFCPFWGEKFGGKVLAQDIHFSQFYMASLQQNPAMAGALYDTQVLINYKDQWRSVGSPYSTSAASFDMKLNQKKNPKGVLAAGISFFNDKAGDGNLSTTQANLSLAYHVKIAQYNTFGGGIQGGFAQRSINYSELSWGSQYNGTTFNTSLANGEPLIGSSKLAPDFSGGILWNYNNTSGEIQVTDNHDLKANIGFSVFHFNQPNISFAGNAADNLNMKYVLHGSGLFSLLNNNLAIVPGFMYCRQGSLQELYTGSMIRFKLSQESKYTFLHKGSAISLGAYYRAKDAMSVNMLFEYSNYAMGLSYDVNTSKLKTVTGLRGGLEITLRFVTPNPFTKKEATRL